MSMNVSSGGSYSSQGGREDSGKPAGISVGLSLLLYFPSYAILVMVGVGVVL
jgi:hypothetical protein